MERLIAAFANSIAGLRHLVRHETAFKQECVLFIIGVPVAWWISDSLGWFLLLVFVLLFMMMVEVLNTAIEAVCDALTEEYNAQIKIAKDCGSLAVLMATGVALVVWLVALVNWLV